MHVITFYSFKGGVGRTMALVNVAAELARRGRKVLVVDFDLEAPGLETYKYLSPPKPHPGIVEYVTEFRRSQQVPNLLDYLYETKPVGNNGGRLWVMPAGRRDQAYRASLASLDWVRLYQDESGFLLFEDTKLGWREELNPDYVFIDSRTGDTDVLGICTRQLPDSVVVMFTPNEQNLAGLENVCRDIRREKSEGLKKNIELHFIAANVPDLDDENGVLRTQMENFHKRLEFERLSGVIRRDESLALLDQHIFTLDRPHSRLARAYRRVLENVAHLERVCLPFGFKFPFHDIEGDEMSIGTQSIWLPKSMCATLPNREPQTVLNAIATSKRVWYSRKERSLPFGNYTSFRLKFPGHLAAFLVFDCFGNALGLTWPLANSLEEVAAKFHKMIDDINNAVKAKQGQK